MEQTVGLDGTCVLLGCLEETRDTLEHMARLGETPDHVVCITPAEAQRQRVGNYVDMRPVAGQYGIPCSMVTDYSLRPDADLELLRRLSPAVLIVVGWQRLVPQSVLTFVQQGTLGFHGSSNILPWGRGRSPINWSIVEGRDRFVLHMFLISPGVDDGDIVGLRVYDINVWDTCRTVYYKTAIAQAELLTQYLPLIRAGTVSHLRQHGEPFYYPKRTPADGRIDWGSSGEQICRLVRAVTWPYPGAFTFAGDVRVDIWAAQPFSRDFFNHAPAGEVCFTAQNGTGEFVVRCGDGTILVTRSEAGIPVPTGTRFH